MAGNASSRTLDRLEPACAEGCGGRRRAVIASLLGIVLLAIYLSNGREVGGGDTVPATLLPLAILRGDGPFLDRFAPAIRDPLGRIPGYGTEARGHAVSRYPIGPALVAVPFTLPQVVFLDLTRPGWDANLEAAIACCSELGKNSAAAISALAAVILWLWLDRRGFGRSAHVAVVAAALGTGMWSTASQALWQHGPAVLCLTFALFALDRPRVSHRLAAAAGLSLALMVACRPIDLLLALPIAAWVRYERGFRTSLALLVPAGLGAIALSLYNVWFFRTLTGGYAQIEQMHPWAHGVRGTWTGNLTEGLLGTLLSPSHGLLVFSPWIVLAVAAVPGSILSQERGSLELALAVGLLASLIALAKYSCWWAGHCYGARFWIDSTPIFALFLAHWLGPDRGVRVGRLLVAIVLIVPAVALQAVGFLCYPSTWYGLPTNADRDHGRLWDWRDSEVTRCLREGLWRKQP